MTALSDAFQNTDKTAALIPFLTAGFPRIDSAAKMLPALAAAGADIIELGVPFSDPMADGPAIQRANERALANGVSLTGILKQVADFRAAGGDVPVVLMGYANSFINYSLARFGKDAAAAGVDGVIIVDLSDAERMRWRTTLAERGIDMISLIAPTTEAKRIAGITESAAGFLYYIALRGVTGAHHLNVEELSSSLESIRRHSSLPLAVGFGVRTAAQATAVAAVADGVVIGSRLVEIMEDDESGTAAAAFIAEVATALGGGD